MKRLLLLAGTTEARDLARALADRRDIDAIASLAGTPRQPSRLALPTRTGGFGGRASFERYLDDEGIDAVIDATHPFAAAISHRTAEVCAARDLPHIQLLRPAWSALEGDDWTTLGDETAAADVVEPGATVFLATGRQTLDRFANLTGRTIYARQIDDAPETFPFAKGRWIVGRPPFSVSDEIALFSLLGVDWLIVKNAGGDASRSKLDAVRHLGVKVGMIERPDQPEAPRVDSVAGALAWIDSLD